MGNCCTEPSKMQGMWECTNQNGTVEIRPYAQAEPCHCCQIKEDLYCICTDLCPGFRSLKNAIPMGESQITIVQEDRFLCFPCFSMKRVYQKTPSNIETDQQSNRLIIEEEEKRRQQILKFEQISMSV